MSSKLWNCLFCRRKTKPDPIEIKILILGLETSGKTQIGRMLSAQERTDFTLTNGLRTYYRPLGNFDAHLIEIGGNDDMRNIWHHYYARAAAIIYVVDISNTDDLRKSCRVLTQVIKHPFVRGKPIMVLANKIDLCANLDVLDFYEEFSLEFLANYYRSHIQMFSCGFCDYRELFSGIEWLRNRIGDDWKKLMNRIKFDMEEEKCGTRERPSVERPSVERPSVERPSVERPSVERPSVERPSVERVGRRVRFDFGSDRPKSAPNPRLNCPKLPVPRRRMNKIHVKVHSAYRALPEGYASSSRTSEVIPEIVGDSEQ